MRRLLASSLFLASLAIALLPSDAGANTVCEYRIVEPNLRAQLNDDRLVETLNELGREGWRVIEVISSETIATTGLGSTSHQYLLERCVEQTSFAP